MTATMITIANFAEDGVEALRVLAMSRTPISI